MKRILAVKEANKHASKQLKAGRGIVGKVAVLGMRERDGRFKGVVLNDTTAETIQAELNSTIADTASLFSDEHRSYQGSKFHHNTVNHSASSLLTAWRILMALKAFGLC